LSKSAGSNARSPEPPVGEETAVVGIGNNVLVGGQSEMWRGPGPSTSSANNTKIRWNPEFASGEETVNV
jgi:hypothetical protein